MITAMKKVCIVPFTSKEWPIVTSLDKTYIVVSVVSPNGIGIGNNDIGILKNRCGMNIYGSTDIKNGFSKCDTVIISKCSDDLREFAIEALEAAVENKKDILCFLNLSVSEGEKYSRICKDLNIKFITFDLMNITSIDATNYKFKKINIPVLYIGEMVENIDGDEIYINTINYYRNKKYKVLGLSENIYTYLYEQVPLKFFSNKDYKQEVIQLNYYVNYMVQEIKPDIIIIQLPKPMIQFSNFIHYDFGISAYMVSNAIPADYLILCTPLGMVNSDLHEIIRDSFLSKFGVEITALHVGNQIVDNSYENVEGEFEFVYDKLEHSLAFADNLRKNGCDANNYTNKKFLHQLLDEIDSEALKLCYGVI